MRLGLGYWWHSNSRLSTIIDATKQLNFEFASEMMLSTRFFALNKIRNFKPRFIKPYKILKHIGP